LICFKWKNESELEVSVPAGFISKKALPLLFASENCSNLNYLYSKLYSKLFSLTFASNLLMFLSNNCYQTLYQWILSMQRRMASSYILFNSCFQATSIFQQNIC
jgi:hypothetical protein